MQNPRKSPVKGRGGKLQEKTIIVQFRRTNRSKAWAEPAVAKAIDHALTEKGYTCEDVLFIEQDVNGNEIRSSWQGEELYY